MRAGNNLHTAILLRAVVDRQPYGNDVIEVADAAFPISRILMPWRCTAYKRILANKVGGPQSNVRPDNRLN
ncbi:hypothetical protein D3C85_1835490 [compost metagenome]